MSEERLEEQRVRRNDSLIALFAPPFDHALFDPRYVKAYVPGVRENGGQYTHAAAWVVIAFAEMGGVEGVGDAWSRERRARRHLTRRDPRRNAYRASGAPTRRRRSHAPGADRARMRIMKVSLDAC